MTQENSSAISSMIAAKKALREKLSREINKQIKEFHISTGVQVKGIHSIFTTLKGGARCDEHVLTAIELYFDL